MATVPMQQMMLEIEPYRVQARVVACPAAFPIDNFTLAYVVPRYVVLHCIPLREERFIALPARSTVLQACVSSDGELFATLELSDAEGSLAAGRSAGGAAKATALYYNQSSARDAGASGQSRPQGELESARTANADNFSDGTAAISMSAQRGGQTASSALPAEKRAGKQSQLGIYSVATQRRISTVLLDEVPERVEFGRQNKALMLFYERKVIFLAWQRAQIDDVFEHREGLCCVEKTSFYSALLVDRRLQIAFFRHQDGEFRECAPSRLCCRLSARVVSCGFLTQQLSCFVCANGEIAVFAPPKFLGFIPCRKEAYTIIEEAGQPARAYLQLKGYITAVAFRGRKILVASDIGEICLLEVADSPFSGSQTTAEAAKSDIFHTGDEQDALLDQLPKTAADCFGGAYLTIYPFYLIQKAVFGAKIRALTLCNYYAVVEGVDGVIYTWPLQAKCLVNAGNSIAYEGDAQAAARETQRQSSVLAFSADLKDMPELAVYKYNEIVTEEADAVVQRTLLLKPSDDQDIASVNLDILFHRLLIQLEPSCEQLKVNPSTSSAVIADLLSGVPQANFPPQPLFQHSSGPRSAIYQTHVLPVGFRLGDANQVGNIRFSRANELTDQLAVVTAEHEIVLLELSTLTQTARFQLNAEIIDLQIHPSGLLLYAVYSEGIGLFVSYASHIQLLSFVTLNGVRKIELSHGGGFLLAACDVGVPVSVKLFTHDLRFLRQLNCHNEALLYMQFLPGDAVIVSVDAGGACYGHFLGSFRRVFECLLRGVHLHSMFIVTANQMERNVLADEIQIADEIESANSHEFRMSHVEDFLLCGVDAQNRFHEISNGRYLHEISMPGTITCHALVLQPSSEWDIPFIARVAQLNQQDELSAIEREGLTATASVFNKSIADALEHKTSLQTPKSDGKNQFFNLQQEIGAPSCYAFTARPIRFVLFGFANGELACYEYPVRSSDCVFRIQLLDGAILGLFVITNSTLVAVSEREMLLCNLKFLLPAASVFGQNVRNRSLSRLKQIFDQNNSGRRTLLKLPLLRMFPAFQMNVCNQNVQQSAERDALLFNIVTCAAEAWRYADFRQALLMQSARERATALMETRNEIYQRARSAFSHLEADMSVYQQSIVKAEQDFKQSHAAVYKTASDSFGRILSDLSAEKQEIKLKIQMEQKAFQSALKELKVERENQLAQLAQQHTKTRIQLQSEIDALDENLNKREMILNEELHQLAEEKAEAVSIITKAASQTGYREAAVAGALRSYCVMQGRRISQIYTQLSDLNKQRELKLGQISQIEAQIGQINQSQSNLLVVLQQKDRALQAKEDEIFQLKQEIYTLSQAHLVLSHQIQQYKNEIRPREELTVDMKARAAELSGRLEASKGAWGQISAGIVKQQKIVDKLSGVIAQNRQQLAFLARALQTLKNELKNIIIDQDQSAYCKSVLKLAMRWSEFGRALRAALGSASFKAQGGAPEAKSALFSVDGAKSGSTSVHSSFAARNREASAAGERSRESQQGQISAEFEAQRAHLQNKLVELYQKLNAEDFKYVSTQAYSLDENSALLNEAHRLRDENLSLKSQLQKVQAMIEALRVKELSERLHAGDKADRSASIGPASPMRGSQSPSWALQQSKRAQSQLSQLEAEKFTLRGIVSQLEKIGSEGQK